MRKVKWRGVKIRKRKMYTLAYANDMVMLAEEEHKMWNMIKKIFIELQHIKDRGN